MSEGPSSSSLPLTFSCDPPLFALRLLLIQVITGVSYLVDYAEYIYDDDGGPLCSCFNPQPKPYVLHNHNTTRCPKVAIAHESVEFCEATPIIGLADDRTVSRRNPCTDARRTETCVTPTCIAPNHVDASRDLYFYFLRTSSVGGGGGGGGGLPDFFFIIFFPCSADHEQRD